MSYISGARLVDDEQVRIASTKYVVFFVFHRLLIQYTYSRSPSKLH